MRTLHLATTVVRLVAASAAMVVTACADRAAAPEAITGRYVLKTINAKPLPYEETREDVVPPLAVRTESGSMTLNNDETWDEKLSQKITTIEGTYVHEIAGRGTWARTATGARLVATAFWLNGKSVRFDEAPFDVEIARGRLTLRSRPSSPRQYTLVFVR